MQVDDLDARHSAVVAEQHRRPEQLQDIVVQIERIGAGAAVENVLREIIRRNVIEYVVAAAAEQDIGPGAAVEMVGERAAVDGLGAAVAHIGLQVEDLRVDVGGRTVVVGPRHERIAVGEGRDRRKPLVVRGRGVDGESLARLIAGGGE